MSNRILQDGQFTARQIAKAWSLLCRKTPPWLACQFNGSRTMVKSCGSMTSTGTRKRKLCINGVPVDYAPDYTFKSPFLNENWNSGMVTISKGNRKKVLNFNRAADN